MVNKIPLDQLKKLDQSLKSLSDAGGDLTTPFAAISLFLENVVRESFAKETSPTGVRWEQLKPTTLDKRKKDGFDGKILQRTTNLLNSILPDSGKDFAAVGTNVIYAASHQFGRKNKNIPARPFLGLNENAVEEISTIIRQHLSNSFQT